MKETQGKSSLIQVSARFKSLGVSSRPSDEVGGRGGHPDPEIRGIIYPVVDH